MNHSVFSVRALGALMIVTAAWCLISCGAADGDKKNADLHVVSSSPEQTISNNREPFQLKFDKPVVDAAHVGKIEPEVPVSINPAIPLEARWIDRHTLSVTPKKAYTASTRYEIEVLAPLADRISEQERTHAFVHDPIRFGSVSGLDVDAAPVNPQFTLRFSQAVNTKDVLAACAIYDSKTAKQIRLKTTASHRADTAIPVAPASQLKQGTAYAVRCKNLEPATGNWPLEQSDVSFFTYPDFSIAEALPKEKNIPPEADKVKIQFATPVSRELFEKHVSVKVNGQRVSNSHWDRTGNGKVYKWDTYLEAVSTYEIWIQKGLADIYNQTLKKTKVIKFDTTDAPPAISTETGISTIESQMEGFQVWTRNVTDLEVACAKVPTSRIAKVVASGDLELYPWVGSDNRDLDWKALSLRPKKETLQISGTKNKWVNHQVDFGKVCGSGAPGGVYLAEFTSTEVQREREKQGFGHYPYRVLGNITDLGVVMKIGPASGVVWVTSMSTGDAVSGARVTLFDLDGKTLHTGTTDNNGLLIVPGSGELKKQRKHDPNEYYDYYSAQRFVAVVENGADAAVVDGDWNSGIALWNYSVKSDRKGDAKRIRGFIQSDRGIYKPGETVHFKALIREVSLGKPPMVPLGKAHIMIDDPGGVTLFDKKQSLSEFGSVDFQLTLNSAARLGDYYAKVTVNDQIFTERFSVEEFRPVSFEVKKDFDAADQLVGDNIRFKFDADYLFGAPVQDAQVMWSVNQRRRYASFSKYPRYSFSENDSYYYWDWYYDDMYGSREGQSFVSSGETRTNRNGEFSFTAQDRYAKEINYPVDYIGRATVTDETDQSVTKTVVVKAHPTDVYLGIKSKSWIQRVSAPIELDLVAVDTEGNSISRTATVELHRESWTCGSSPNTGYRCEHNTEKVSSQSISIEKNGSVLSMPVKAPGDYIVKLLGKDNRGKKVSSATSVWVTGRGYFFWGGEDNHKMTLIPSEEKYAPGDVARIIPKGGTENSTLLVTVERNGIIDTFTMPGKETGGAIEIPIKEDYAPNVYVSVSAVTPRSGKKDSERPTFMMGIVDLKVSAREKELKVVINTDKSEYEPGETVRGKITVTSKGAPVKSELSVSVADEGVLQLINYQTPNPMNAIYAPFGLGVDSSSNLLRLARFRNPVDDSEEGADGGDNTGPTVRSKFVSSAFWIPDLVTDENGVADFEFTAPDNLTAFRVMTVAADTKDKFGASDERIVINKKLLVTPVLPRFFGSGDWVNIGAVVHNYSKTGGEVQVNWKLRGLWTKTSGETITLQSGESKRVGFNVKVGKQKQATVQISASMKNQDDAFSVTVPIRRNITTSQKLIFESKTTDTKEVALEWPDDVDEKFSEVGISVDRFGLGMLSESLKYLIQYPYGCLEQTLSRLLPMFKVRDLAASMKLDELQGPKLKQFISFGVDKVLKHQHDDGHFSLWPGSHAEPHLTAYAMWGLSEAEKAGIKVSRHHMEKGIAALQQWINQQQIPADEGRAGEAAMTAFVLAHYGKPDAGLNARLFEARNIMPVYGKAFLLRAMVFADDGKEMQTQLVAEILEAAKLENGKRFIEEHTSLPYYMSSNVRSTAMAISALIAYDASMPEIEELVEGLKSRRDSSGRWSNTQENIYSLIALSDYIRAQGPGEASVTILLNEKEWQTFKVTGSKIVRFQRPLHKLSKGTLQVVSDSPVYVHVNMGLAREAADNKGENQGFTVTREYLNPKTGAPVENVKAGTLVKVRLTVESTSSRAYVAVADPLPGGCEAVNTNLATEDTSLQTSTHSRYFWDYVELRDDEILAFADKMYSGSRTIEYLMRATIPGTFSVPGTLVEEMYAPAHFGTSDERTFKVLK
ncbi:MAG: hypothetical protein JXX29_12070 [Deltaproteobacteria bacterium]|nr:hypothetical protein [Deltaproteobacteria bacterium]MBN2672409.1 hypothetical protein [Deltaproteobacteria bacterium]